MFNQNLTAMDNVAGISADATDIANSDPFSAADSDTVDPDNVTGVSPRYTPSTFIDFCNQTLEYAYGSVEIIGEVASFKINQGKWVFFDLKDANSSLGCFMPVWDLRTEIADGMKVIVRATPKVTKWGKFSLTIRRIQPLGEGNIKKSFELLKRKLAAEGLFDPAKKRPLPDPLTKIAVISSTQAAGYADFIKIINARWGGLEVKVAHTQVQGLDAADQIIRALRYFNEKAAAQAIIIIRGGGSQDDLAVFNDEALTRAVATSRIPVVTGIGHEIDHSLCDLAADLAASTPSNAAELITRDRHAEIAHLRTAIHNVTTTLEERISAAMIDRAELLALRRLIDDKIIVARTALSDSLFRLRHDLVVKITTSLDALHAKTQILAALNPDKVLEQGYAILSGKISPGATLTVTTINNIIETEVKNVQPRK